MRFANGRYELSTANSGAGGVDRMKAYHGACFDDIPSAGTVSISVGN
jgi:hypothetical protein